jgi:hypothetical protein
MEVLGGGIEDECKMDSSWRNSGVGRCTPGDDAAASWEGGGEKRKGSIVPSNKEERRRRPRGTRCRGFEVSRPFDVGSS